MSIAEIICILLLAAVAVIQIFDFVAKGFADSTALSEILLTLLPVSADLERLELTLFELTARHEKSNEKIILLLLDDCCENADICRSYAEQYPCFEVVSYTTFEERFCRCNGG